MCAWGSFCFKITRTFTVFLCIAEVRVSSLYIIRYAKRIQAAARGAMARARVQLLRDHKRNVLTRMRRMVRRCLVKVGILETQCARKLQTMVRARFLAPRFNNAVKIQKWIRYCKARFARQRAAHVIQKRYMPFNARLISSLYCFCFRRSVNGTGFFGKYFVLLTFCIFANPSDTSSTRRWWSLLAKVMQQG